MNLDEQFQFIIGIFEGDISGDLDFLCTDNILYEGGNLGIPVSIIRELYNLACQQFHSKKNFSTQSKLDASLVMAVLNPESTILNYRKSRLESDIKPEFELRFCKFLLSKHQSDSCVWQHLYYLDYPYVEELLAICDLASDRKKANYYCWGFRRKIIRIEPRVIIDLELAKNQVFVRSHISDISGWAYRQFLLRRSNVCMIKEIGWIKNLIILYPNHESLWLHLRSLVCTEASCAIELIKFAESLDHTHGSHPTIFISYTYYILNSPKNGNFQETMNVDEPYFMQYLKLTNLS